MAGRSISGHQKSIRWLGEHPKFAPPPPEGVEALCKCGWRETYHRLGDANKGYTAHLASVIGSGIRHCSTCGLDKPLTEMGVRVTHMCKSCITAKAKAWGAQHPERFARQRRNSHLLNNFGITVDEWDALFESQGGVCAICGAHPRDPRGYSMHTDHDHSTGVVRGILCHGCNNGLGQFSDDVERIRAAAKYLANPRPLSGPITYRGALGLRTVPAELQARIEAAL